MLGRAFLILENLIVSIKLKESLKCPRCGDTANRIDEHKPKRYGKKLVGIYNCFGCDCIFEAFTNRRYIQEDTAIIDCLDYFNQGGILEKCDDHNRAFGLGDYA